MHGIMFHNFHDHNKHKKIQGSISSNDFYKIIKHIGRENILDADIFFEKLKNNRNHKKVCFTFDDASKSQIDIALPILKKFKIKSLFFVYSKIFNRGINLEVERYFRNNYYPNIDKFYIDFFTLLEKKYRKKINIFFKKNKKKFLFIKKNYKFYSNSDIKFRLVRDEFISKALYTKIIVNLMKTKKFNFNKAISKLLMSKKDLVNLVQNDHIIGLHSHSHPTNIEKLSYKDQLNEYLFNKKQLEKITEKETFSASYPNGKYNKYSLKILRNLKINYSFISNMKINKNYKLYNFTIPREDHTNIINNIK